MRFVGDEVAAVAAETEEIAEDALRLIEVEYEPLPFVADLEAALRPDAPKLREGGNIAGEPKVYERGDVEAGLAAGRRRGRADLHHPDRAAQLPRAARLHRHLGGRPS